MKLDVGVIKKHPILSTAVIVGGGLVMYFVFMKGDSPVSGGSSMGYGDMQVAGASELQLINAQQAGQAQQLQAQLAATQIEASNNLAVAETNADLQLALGALSLEALRVQQATEMYGIQRQADIQLAGMESAEDIARLQASNELAALQSNNATQVAIQQMMTQAQVGIAGMSAQVSMAGIAAQENISVQTLQATTNMAGMAYETQIALGEQTVETRRIDSQTQIALAREQGRTARQGSSNSMWGAVAGAALMMFSDMNIKSVHGCVDVARCLFAVQHMPIDFWRYTEGSVADDGGKMHAGTYAQEFYRNIGSLDWAERKMIDVVDYMGVLTGAIKALSMGEKHGPAN